MTRKDYLIIASIISHYNTILCDLLKEDNPRFDEYKFIEACMPKHIKVIKVTKKP